MKALLKITKPTLILDEAKCKANIEHMALKAKKHKVNFRPHFKTHQSLEIGRWFKSFGVTKIAVSSLSMADYFSEEWNDITVAFPTNILEIDTINSLAKRIVLNLTIENIESIVFLEKHLKHSVNVFLQIDVGYHRTGIDPEKKEIIDSILDQIEKNKYLNFKGFLAHSGHTYLCNSKDSIEAIHAESLKVMSELKATYAVAYPDLINSLGDTPSCSVSENFSGVDEIRPGNFVFYDLMQHYIGSNSIEEIGVVMACPIVAIHHDRSEIVVYGGGVHLSKDRLIEGDTTVYGKIVKKTENGWGDLIPDAFVKSLSQEHGIIFMPKNHLVNYRIGDCLMIIPIHSCMSANLMTNYMTLDGIYINRF